LPYPPLRSFQSGHHQPRRAMISHRTAITPLTSCLTPGVHFTVPVFPPCSPTLGPPYTCPFNASSRWTMPTQLHSQNRAIVPRIEKDRRRVLYRGEPVLLTREGAADKSHAETSWFWQCSLDGTRKCRRSFCAHSFLGAGYFLGTSLVSSPSLCWELGFQRIVCHLSMIWLTSCWS